MTLRFELFSQHGRHQSKTRLVYIFIIAFFHNSLLEKQVYTILFHGNKIRNLYRSRPYKIRNLYRSRPYCRRHHQRLLSSVQSLSRVRLFETPWIGACQASLSITNSRSSLRLTSIESVMPSSHLILCHPLLLLPPIPPSILGLTLSWKIRLKLN